MWKKLNSPIVIVIIALAGLYGVLELSQSKSTLAQEIRGAYDEINAIVKEGSSEAEKTKAIQEFAKEIAMQIRGGFGTGFGDDESEKKAKDKEYVETRSKVKIIELKKVKSSWSDREKYVFAVKNESDKTVSSIKLNYEFYQKGKLIDCENRWVSQVKLLGPGEEVAVSKERRLPGEDSSVHSADEIRVKVTSLDIR